MKVSDTYFVKFIDIDYEAKAICKIDDFLVFVANGLKDEVAKIKITAVKKNYAIGIIIKLIEASPYRVLPDCKYFEECNGCNLMHLHYEEQCNYKTKLTKETLKKIGNIDFEVNKIIQADQLFEYRNKIQVPFKQIENTIFSGFYKENTHEVVPIEKCLIEPNTSSLIINKLKELFALYNISIYEEETHQGLIRHVVIRVNKKNEAMVILVTNGMKKLNEIIDPLVFDNKNIISIYQNINTNKTNVILGEKYEQLYGEKYLTDYLFDLEFKISPSSFFQINRHQTHKLYQTAIDLLKLDKKDIVIDAYCGIGTISLLMAKKAKYVYGIEIVKDAIENANMNQEINNIANVEFILGKCEEEIKKLVDKKNISAIVFDPPRKGCDKSFLETIIAMKIPKIVYISCNLKTLARDLAILKHFYTIQIIQPVEMFVHSCHVETVVSLHRKLPL